jgi:hypothetical protein
MKAEGPYFKPFFYMLKLHEVFIIFGIMQVFMHVIVGVPSN